VDVRIVDREAGVPDPPALGLATRQVGLVLDGGAEARRAHERAVAARQAPGGHVVPARVLQVALEQVAEVEGLHRAAHPAGGGFERTLRLLDVGRLARPAGESAEQLGAPLRAGLDEEAMLALEQLGDRQIGTGFDFRAGAHRRAEARAARLEAVDRDQEDVLAPQRVVAVGVGAAEEDAVLDRDRVQLARAHADEGERPVVAQLLVDHGCVAVAAGAPQAHPRWKEEALPRVRADGEAEAGLVIAPFEAVAPAVLAIGPPDRKLARRGKLVVDDRSVAERRAEHAVPVVAKPADQIVERFHRDDELLRHPGAQTATGTRTRCARSTSRFEYPHSLSYQATTFTWVASMTAVRPASKIDENGDLTMSDETSGSSL